MFAPKLYRVNKVPLKHIINANLNLEVKNEEKNQYSVLQQDNQYFRQIRSITSDDIGTYIPYIIFVDCNGARSEENISKIVANGFKFNGRRYVASERSASMVRQSMLSFVDKRLVNKLNEITTMGIEIGKTVLSKWYAYRGLMLSSCHCVENWKPKMIVVSDREEVIRNQKIKYVIDTETEFVDKEGNERVWKQKDITEGVKDIEINLFDGCGIHHPEITEQLVNKLSELGNMKDSRPTSVLIRAPFIKGMSHEIDYIKFFEERGVEFIKDIWGTWHDVRPNSTPMMIMTESMYKGLKYFKAHGDKRDWEHYWDMFDKYNHCIGIVKWNYTLEKEEVYRRGNYQILQDLKLEYEEFEQLVEYSKDWIEKITSGNWKYVSCFLGLLAERYDKPSVAVTNYISSMLKNPIMVHESGVRKYLTNNLNKYIDEMKCGKIYLRATNRFLMPDMIMFMEHIGGLPLVGCLEHDEFWTDNLNSTYVDGKDYLIERNPHISKSEHSVLRMTTNDDIKYVEHLANTCMVNSKSLIMQRLNGADVDGDQVLVVDNELMLKGVERDIAIVIDIEDKIAAMEQEDTLENKVQVIMLGMHSLIGETSNAATTYHNKMPQTEETAEKYQNYIALLSVINGKVIDSAKTGVIFKIPRHIAKWSKPLPYFMRYAGEYYSRIKKWLHSESNMNRLCRHMEKFHSGIKWPRRSAEFNYQVMIDNDTGIDIDLIPVLEQLYLTYNNELSQMKRDELSIQKETGGASKFELKWDEFYEKYRNKCLEICPDKSMLVNILVTICYEMYPRGTTGFLWNMAGDYIADNIKQVDILLPVRDECNGDFEYLGKKYRMDNVTNPVVNDIIDFDMGDYVEEYLL